MKIGIDMDNTLTNTLPVLTKYCILYNEDVVKRNLTLNSEGYNPPTLFDWTEEEILGFSKQYLEKACWEATVKQDAKEVLETLQKQGHSLYFITARRKPYFADPTLFTKNYLEKHQIPYDKIIAECPSKAAYCVQEGIDVMIDDEIPNVTSVAKYIPVLCMQAKHNEWLQGNNIIPVKDWIAVKAYFEKR